MLQTDKPRFRQASEISPARFDPDEGRKKWTDKKSHSADQLNCHFAQMSPLHFLCVNSLLAARTKRELLAPRKTIPRKSWSRKWKHLCLCSFISFCLLLSVRGTCLFHAPRADPSLFDKRLRPTWSAWVRFICEPVEHAAGAFSAVEATTHQARGDNPNIYQRAFIFNWDWVISGAGWLIAMGLERPWRPTSNFVWQRKKTSQTFHVHLVPYTRNFLQTGFYFLPIICLLFSVDVLNAIKVSRTIRYTAIFDCTLTLNFSFNIISLAKIWWKTKKSWLFACHF